MICLGIDLGSSTIKGAVLDLDAGTVANVRSRTFPEPITGLPPGHWEISLSEILRLTRELLSELVDADATAKAVFFSSQMGGLILADEREPPTHYISWRDQRSVTSAGARPTAMSVLRERISAEQFQQIGQELKPGGPTALLFSLAQQGQLQPGMQPLSLGSYVTSVLCERQPCIDPSEALGTCNLITGDWHRELYHSLGIDDLQWPRLQSYRQSCGTIRCHGRELVCHPAVGDHPCALLGVGLVEQELSINASTGSQVSVLTKNCQLGNWQTRYGFDNSFLNTITHLPAGRSLNALVSLLGTFAPPGSDLWPAIVAAVDAKQTTDLEIDLSFFDGALGSSGRMGNMTIENLTLGDLFLAAFRNMADNYKLCSERLSACGPWNRLVLSGGLTQRVPRLRQLIQERIALPVRECPERDDTMYGLLRLAQNVYGADIRQSCD